MTTIDPQAVIQTVPITDDDLKFQTPCAVCISGPSQSGKSSFIVKLVECREVMFNQKFERLYYCQPPNLCIGYNPVFEQICKTFPSAELVSGLPDVTKLQLDIDSTSKLLILDDLMVSLLNSEEMVHLFTVQIHHSNITCLFTLHNIYSQSRFSKTISRNIAYSVLFYNRLDLRELKTISSQISNNSNFLLDCFKFLMEKFAGNNAYIVIDGSYQSKMKSMFIRSHVFPSSDGSIKPIIFFPNRQN